MLKGVQHNMFSRTSPDKLLNKIHCSNVLKDEKIEAVHNLLEQQQAVYLWQFDLQQGMAGSLARAPANDDVISGMHFA